MTKSLLALSLVLLLNTQANAALNAGEIAQNGKPGDSADFTPEAVHLAGVLAINSVEVAKLLDGGYRLESVKIEIIASNNKKNFSDTQRYTVRANKRKRIGQSPFSGTTYRRSLVLDGVMNFAKSWDQQVHYTSSGVRTHAPTND